MGRARIIMLGGPRLDVDGVGVRLSNKALVVLGSLAIAPQHVVPVEPFLDAFWSGSPPARRLAYFDSFLSKLRSRLVAHGCDFSLGRDGKALRLDGDFDLDIAEFRAELAMASTIDDPKHRIGHLEHARSLWADPFAGLGTSFFDAAAVRLERDHSELLAQLVLTTAALGRDHEARSLADELPDSHLRSDVTLCVVDAEERLGLVSSALRRLDEFRRQAQAHGHPINQRVIEREQTLLRLGGRGGLSRAPVVPGDDIVVGRSRLVSSLHESLESVLIVAEAGTGKSSLLQALAADLQGGGTRTALLRVPTEQAHALAPIGDLVVDVGVDVAALDQRTATAVARVVPAYRDLAITGAIPLERRELVQLLGAALAASASATGTVILVDDLHHLDAISTMVLVAALDANRLCRIIATARPPEAGERHPFAASDRVQVTPLPPLELDDVREYIGQRYRRAPERHAERVYTLAGGNALFVKLLVDHDLEYGLDDSNLPPNIVETAARNMLSLLSRDERSVLEHAAVLGMEHSFVTLQRVWRASRMTEDDAFVAGAVSRAVEAGLLQVDWERDRVRFVHALVAQATYQLLDDGRRRDLHEVIGSELKRRGELATTYARHLGAVAEVDPHAAATAHLEAARHLGAETAYERARVHCEEGLDVASQQGLADDAVGLELLLELGRTLRLLGDEGYGEVLLELIDRCASLPGVQARSLQSAALVELCSHGKLLRLGRVGGPQERVVQRTTELVREALVGDMLSDEDQILVAAVAPNLFAFSQWLDEALAAYRGAFAHVRVLGGSDLQRHVMLNAHLGLGRAQDAAARMRAPAILRQLADPVDIDVRWEASFLDHGNALLRGRRADLDRAIIEIRELTPGADHRQLAAIHCEVAHAHAIGDLSRACEWLDEARELAPKIRSAGWVEVVHLGMEVALAQDVAEFGVLLERVERVLHAYPEFVNWHAVRAMLAARLGDRSRAIESLSLVSTDGFGGLSNDMTWLAATWCAADAVLRTGWQSNVEAFAGRLARYQRRMAWSGQCIYGPVDLALARLATAHGDPDTAIGHYRRSNRNVKNLGCVHYEVDVEADMSLLASI